MTNFEKITGQQKKSIRNHGLIAMLLIVVGILVAFAKQVSGYISLIMGVLLLVTVWTQYRNYSREMEKVRGNLEQFKKEVNEGKIYDAFGLILTPDYAVVDGREHVSYTHMTMPTTPYQ